MSTYKPCGCKNTATANTVAKCSCVTAVPVTELKFCDPPTDNTGCGSTLSSDCVVVGGPKYSFVLTKELIEINKAITKLQEEVKLIKETCCNNCSMVMSNITVS